MKRKIWFHFLLFDQMSNVFFLFFCFAYLIIVSISSLWFESKAAISWMGLHGVESPIETDPLTSPLSDRQYWAISLCSSSLKNVREYDFILISVIKYGFWLVIVRIWREFRLAAVKDRWRYRVKSTLADVDLRRIGGNFRRSRIAFECRLNGQIPEPRVLLKVSFRFELVAESASKIFQIFARCRL